MEGINENKRLHLNDGLIKTFFHELKAEAAENYLDIPISANTAVQHPFLNH